MGSTNSTLHVPHHCYTAPQHCSRLSQVEDSNLTSVLIYSTQQPIAGHEAAFSALCSNCHDAVHHVDAADQLLGEETKEHSMVQGSRGDASA